MLRILFFYPSEIGVLAHSKSSCGGCRYYQYMEGDDKRRDSTCRDKQEVHNLTIEVPVEKAVGIKRRGLIVILMRQNFYLGPRSHKIVG